MTKDYELLKADIQALYPDQEFTDAELNEMTDRLIKFFATGAKAMQESKRRERLLKLHEERKNPPTDTPNTKEPKNGLKSHKKRRNPPLFNIK
jgi:hypothetical protein